VQPPYSSQAEPQHGACTATGIETWAKGVDSRQTDGNAIHVYNNNNGETGQTTWPREYEVQEELKSKVNQEAGLTCFELDLRGREVVSTALEISRTGMVGLTTMRVGIATDRKRERSEKQSVSHIFWVCIFTR
jgi:hypothetical protein